MMKRLILLAAVISITASTAVTAQTRETTQPRKIEASNKVDPMYSTSQVQRNRMLVNEERRHDNISYRDDIDLRRDRNSRGSDEIAWNEWDYKRMIELLDAVPTDLKESVEKMRKESRKK